MRKINMKKKGAVNKVFLLAKKAFSIFYIQAFGKLNYARKVGVDAGDGCRLYITDWGTEPFLITIGENVTIAPGVRILTHDGATSLVKKSGNRYQKFLPVSIGSNCFIGAGSILMPGVSLGDNVIVAAGSVVSKNVSCGIIVGGNPAKSIGCFDEYSRKVMHSYVNEIELKGCFSYVEKVNKAVDIYYERNN